MRFHDKNIMELYGPFDADNSNEHSETCCENTAEGNLFLTLQSGLRVQSVEKRNMNLKKKKNVNKHRKLLTAKLA